MSSVSSEWFDDGSSISSASSVASDDGDSKQQPTQLRKLFATLVKQRDVSGVRALLESMDDEARSKLFDATRWEFRKLFTPRVQRVLLSNRDLVQSDCASLSRPLGAAVCCKCVMGSPAQFTSVRVILLLVLHHPSARALR